MLIPSIAFVFMNFCNSLPHLLGRIYSRNISLSESRRRDGESSTAIPDRSRTALDCGADSVFMRRYDSCRTISAIACEEPMAVWNAYLDEVT